MPTPTIIATPGAVNANSYCTRAEADAYHDTRLHSEDWPANVRASASIGDGADGTVTLTVVEPGTEGNSYTVTVVEGAAAGALSAALVGTALTVTLAMDSSSPPAPVGNTATLVAAAVTAVVSGLLTAVASGAGTGALDEVQALTAFSGGSYVEEVKNPALIEATRILDSMYEWLGMTATSTQKLLWPRYGIWDKNQWNVIPITVIPDELKWAVAELARQLIVADRTLDSDIETLGVTSLRAGSVSLTFKDSVVAKVIPDAVVYLIPVWWGFLRDSGIRRVVRG